MTRYKQFIPSLCLILSSSLGLLLSFSVTAKELKPGDVLPPPIKLQIITEGLESSIISLSLSMSGKPVKAITKSCASCPGREFTISPETTFNLGRAPIALENVSSFSGKSGTVVYYPETNIVHSINFFNLED